MINRGRFCIRNQWNLREKIEETKKIWIEWKGLNKKGLENVREDYFSQSLKSNRLILFIMWPKGLADSMDEIKSKN